MKRLFLPILTIIFLVQPILLLGVQQGAIPALTIAQARELQRTGSSVVVQAASTITAQQSTIIGKQFSQGVPTTSGQPPQPKYSTHEPIKAAKKRLAGYENAWQSIKNMALLPLSTSIMLGAQSVGLWGASAAVNKVTGCQAWPWWTKPIPLIKTGGPLSQFSKSSFMDDVVYGLPQAIGSSLVTSAVDGAAYQIMKVAGCERYTFNSLIAACLHAKGYEAFIKDQKTLLKCQHIHNKIQKRLFRKIKAVLQEQKKDQLKELNMLSQEQLEELVKKGLPDHMHRMFFAQAITLLTPVERKNGNHPNVQQKINKIMVDIFKNTIAEPVSDQDVHIAMAQVPQEEIQKLMLEVIQTLSEKEQKLFKKVIATGKIMKKQLAISKINTAQFFASMFIKTPIVGSLIGAPIAAWLLKNAFGWVTPTTQPSQEQMKQLMGVITKLEEKGYLKKYVRGTSPMSR